MNFFDENSASNFIFSQQTLFQLIEEVSPSATLVLDGDFNPLYCNASFCTMFQTQQEEGTSLLLPEAILTIPFLKDSSQKSGLLKFTTNSGEEIELSYLANSCKAQSGEVVFILTFTDLTPINFRDTIKHTLLEVTHAANSSEEIAHITSTVLKIIADSMGAPSAFLCFLDQVNRTISIESQIGLNELYTCHSCSYCMSDKSIPENKRSCYLAYHEKRIAVEGLFNHSVSKYIEDPRMDHQKHSIIHIPMFSDGGLMGLLHIVAPNQKISSLFVEKEILNLIGYEISVGIKRIRLIQEIRQYADNLEKIIKIRTAQLREKDAQIIQSGKLATLGELATGIAHEINQPLGGISLISQGLILAKSKGKLDETLLGEKLNEILAQINRINSIITHLRTFARQTDNFKVEIDIRKPLLDVFKLIGQQLINKQIEVTLEIDDDIPLIMAEHNRLEQIFLNFLSNARDALFDMEKTVLELERKNALPEELKGWRKKILIKAYREQDRLTIEFWDNAGGIPKDILNKIFEPFFTTKEVGKGTGLGLSITYGIVKDFSGVIEVESEALKGTKFIVKFPAI